MIPTPIIPGHEFFGYAEELGEGADNHFGVKRGDRIIAENILPCRECKFCKVDVVLFQTLPTIDTDFYGLIRYAVIAIF